MNEVYPRSIFSNLFMGDLRITALAMSRDGEPGEHVISINALNVCVECDWSHQFDYQD